MRIGAPHQARRLERRIAMTPDIAQRFIQLGHQVEVERDAGAAAGFASDEYAAAGCTIVDSAWDCDFVAVVTLPNEDEIARLRPDTVLLGLLSPLEHPQSMRALAKTGITAMAFETLPRTTRAQSMDVLSSQATLAGYQMVLEAATRVPRILPMLTTAAGTLRPATVVVLGAGVAGLQAIATARRLGAVVSAFDVRSAAAEQVESLGARFISIDLEPQDAAASGGYAKELAADEAVRLVDGLQAHLHKADIVLTAAAIPGRPAPILVTEETVHAMRAGSVIVDGAAATGGNCALTVADEERVVGGVTILGPTDLPSRVAAHASAMFARNVYELIAYATEGDSLDFEDEIVSGVTITRDGRVVHPAVQAVLEGSP